MSRRRSHDTLRNMTNIDVTPLVDLTFLLLIVFMITAPVLEKAVDVSPPDFNAAPIDDTPHRVINLDRQGRILLGSQTISEDALGAELARIRTQEPDMLFFIRADETRPYGEVMTLMKIARRAGVSNVSLVTQAEDD